MIQQNLIYMQGQIYRKGNQISSGGQAVIYQGENIKTHEKVAIRVANQMTEDEYNIYQILINQKKRFIIDVKGIEYQEEKGTMLTVMELGKENFHSFMEKDEFKQLTNLDKNLVFRQMVSAVHELHELQYFHRNLKTENFILIENLNKNHSNIKLIDFGLCKHTQNQNRQTQNIGAILFMAPEVLSSDQYDKSSDIWSLGCIYYEIMTTKTFLQGRTYQALTDQIQTIQQNQIDQVIDHITQMNFDEKNLLKRMLQKEPSQRLTLKEILQQLDNLTKTKFQPIYQGQSFNIFPQIPISPQQFPQWNIQKQQQLSAERLQTQIKNDIDQKYQKQHQEDIAKLKNQIDEQLQQQTLQKQKEIEQQNQDVLSRLEKEIKQKCDLKIQQCLQDKEKLKDLQLAQELETQNRLNKLQIQQKEELQKNLNMFQLPIKQHYEKQLEQIIKEKETQIYAQIEFEYKKIFTQKWKELKDDENEKIQQQFETQRNGVVKIVTCYIELLSKNQNLMIQKQKVLKTLEQQHSQQVSQINSKINNFLSILEQNLLKANQVRQDFQKTNDNSQLNKLGELENEYQEKITQLTRNSFKNIQQIDQDIENLNRNDQQIIKEEQIKEKEQKYQRLYELKKTLEQQLSQQRDQLNKMKQLANILLHEFQEYEMVQLNQKFNNEIVAVNQQELKLNLIQNQFEQIKDQDLFRHEESLHELSQQCRQIELQSQNLKEIFNIFRQEFLKNEQIQLQYLNNFLIEVENQFDQLKRKYDSFRKEFHTIQVKEINDCENKFYEIQLLIKKIYFQRQQFCVKKQKQTFNFIKQKFEEFEIQYEQAIRIAEQLVEANKCQQQYNEIMKKLQKLKYDFEFQIETFQQKSLNFRVNQEVQLQLQQQLDFLRHNFKNYVQKYQDFESFINDTAKDYQLNELKQPLIELEQFCQESDQKIKELCQQAQTIYQKINMSQQLENEKWSQFSDLCQKMHSFQQQSKECQFPKDVAFCEYLCQSQRLIDLFRKYEEHFDQCQQNYKENEQIGKELQVKLTQNQDEFKQAKESNLQYINQIKQSAESNFLKLNRFLNSIFNVHKKQIKFVKDSSFYQSIYDSYKSYQQLIQQEDSLNQEIQNYYQKENQYDNNFYNDKIKVINAHITQLGAIKYSLNQFEEVEFQKDKKCFIRLVFFLIVIQFFILIEIIQRQLRHEDQQKMKYNKSQKYEEFQAKMIKYQNDKIKFEQFLSLNEIHFNYEYLKLIEYNDDEIEIKFHAFFLAERVTLRGKIKNQDTIKQVLEYYRTIEYSKFIILKTILNMNLYS